MEERKPLESRSPEPAEVNPVPESLSARRPHNYAPPPRPYRRAPRSIFWPVVLIGAGVLLLLSNLGYFPATNWAILWRLWPLALVALGIDVMIGRRSTGGAIASLILIILLLGAAFGIAVFAENIPFLVALLEPAQMQHRSESYPLEGIERASVFIDWTSAPAYLRPLDDSTNLIEATVGYRGELNFDVARSGDRADVTLESYLQGVSYGTFDFGDEETKWDVRLNPRVTYELELDCGSGRGQFDLTDLDVAYLKLDIGSGAVDLDLPARSTFDGIIDGGSGSLTLLLPEDVGLRVDLDSGSGGFFAGDRLRWISGDRDGDSVWESANYDEADYRIDLEIDQGSGSITIR